MNEKAFILISILQVDFFLHICQLICASRVRSGQMKQHTKTKKNKQMDINWLKVEFVWIGVLITVAENRNFMLS